VEESAKVVDGQVIALDETRNGWSIQAHDAEVGLVALGFGVRIVVYVDGGETLDISIASPIRLDSTAGPRDIDPQQPSRELGEFAVGLLHRRLARCDASSDGQLHLQFGEGPVLVVAANPSFEAWDIEAPLFKLTSLPGGEIAYWDRTDPVIELNLEDI
jgi:hypothetical protein